VDTIPVGRTAVISQSGSVIGTILSRGHAAGQAYAAFVSTGNEAQMGVGDIGLALVDDPAIDAFIVFLETLRGRETFAAFAASADAAGKPIVAYSVGRTCAGQALAQSHTGAMTGGAQALHAWLRAHDVREVASLDALIEAPSALRAFGSSGLRRRSEPTSARGKPERGVVVITTTGGGGAMMVDTLAADDVPLCALSDETRRALAALGVHSGAGPLVDVTLAGATYETMRAVVDCLIRADEVALVMAVIGSSAQFHPELAVRPLIDAAHAASEESAALTAPVMAFALPHAPESLALLAGAGVPAFRTVESAAETVALALRASVGRTGASADARRSGPSARTTEAVAALLNNLPEGLCTEAQGARVFAALGIPMVPHRVVRVDESDDAAAALWQDDHHAAWTRDFGTTVPVWPVAAKLLSRDIAHKSDVGAVRLSIDSAQGLRHAIVDMEQATRAAQPDAVIDGALVQPMVRGLGNAIIGFTRDPAVGPVVTVGAGGVMAEIYRDIAVGIAPITPGRAMELIDQIAGFALLRGYRNHTMGDLEGVAQAVAALSELAHHPRVVEAEINPLFVQDAAVVGVDAVLRLS
ncbi:MAG: acetate--CoA ligase family protein, partial [Pseudomonadota bacterium]